MTIIDCSKPKKNMPIARANVPQKYFQLYDSIASKQGDTTTIDTDLEKNLFATYISEDVRKGLLKAKDYEEITGFKYLNRERFKEIEQELSKKPSVNKTSNFKKDIKIFRGSPKLQ